MVSERALFYSVEHWRVIECKFDQAQVSLQKWRESVDRHPFDSVWLVVTDCIADEGVFEELDDVVVVERRLR